MMTATNILAGLSDLEACALTVYGEARGEPIEGQIAVANVIKNRALKHKSSYKEVCLEPQQFSCWNKNDPNYPLLLQLGEELILNQELKNDYFKQIQYLVAGVDSGILLDNTHGNVNYITTELFGSPKQPVWARVAKNKITIGNHIFFTA